MCRYLYLTDRTFSLLRQTHLHHLGDDHHGFREVDFKRSFPRITLVSVANPEGSIFEENDGTHSYAHLKSLRLEIYKPIRIDDLRGSCLHFAASERRICVHMFGIQILKPLSGESNFLHIGNITDVVVRSGGGILPSSRPPNIGPDEQGLRLGVSSDFWLVVKDAAVGQLTRSTINLVMHYARLNRQVSLGIDDQHPIRFEGELLVRCSSSVLELFVQIVR